MIYPKHFFTTVDTHEEEDLVFVVMPFGPPHDEIYNNVIEPTVQELGMQCLRSDEIFSVKPIMQDILQGIMTASVIIADVTGRNPNVFYELGITHSVKDRDIIITQSMDDVPFDLKHIRTIIYGTSVRGIRHFSLRLKATIETVMKQPSFPLFPVKGAAKAQPVEAVEEPREGLRLQLMADTFEVRVSNVSVQLTEEEFTVVHYLYSTGQPVSVSSITEVAFGSDYLAYSKFDNLMASVQRKLMRLPGHPVILRKGTMVELVFSER